MSRVYVRMGITKINTKNVLNASLIVQNANPKIYALNAIHLKIGHYNLKTVYVIRIIMNFLQILIVFLRVNAKIYAVNVNQMDSAQNVKILKTLSYKMEYAFVKIISF